jgi:hypothetical protein
VLESCARIWDTSTVADMPNTSAKSSRLPIRAMKSNIVLDIVVLGGVDVQVAGGVSKKERGG